MWGYVIKQAIHVEVIWNTNVVNNVDDRQFETIPSFVYGYFQLFTSDFHRIICSLLFPLCPLGSARTSGYFPKWWQISPSNGAILVASTDEPRLMCMYEPLVSVARASGKWNTASEYSLLSFRQQLPTRGGQRVECSIDRTRRKYQWRQPKIAAAKAFCKV